MSDKFQQAKQEAKENGVNPDGFHEFTTHVLDENNDIGYLTVDVWADEDILSDISPGLNEAFAESHKPEHDDYLARNIPAILRNDLIWDCMCSEFDIESPGDLQEALDSGRIKVMRY